MCRIVTFTLEFEGIAFCLTMICDAMQGAATDGTMSPRLSDDNQKVYEKSLNQAQTLVAELPQQIPIPTYERVFGKAKKGELRGRNYLKLYFPQQWRIYNMNLRCVRNWFNNNDDPRISSFFLTNMRHNETSQADVKSFIKERYGVLAGFIFVYQGSTIKMHWKEEDVYEYFKEYKHSRNKNNISKDFATTSKVSLDEKCVIESETHEEVAQDIQSLPSSSSAHHPLEEAQVCM